MKKTDIGRCIFGLLALFFMGTGLMLMFSPANMLNHMFIEPIESAGGLSSIRAIWGGTTIAVWASVLLGAIRSNVDYICVGFIALLMVFVGRLVGYFADGSFPQLVVSVIPTTIAMILMLIAYKLMVSTTDKTA
ncbi:DUF4345 family protein [Aliikangiella coralliicola]|uniref:DUF4345 domain-containing protein n=1 Tax=Aliikangiella coralliicola TaxID=2592383 RepID=A0A545U698_9GAMM|nr:DUF4345 family protein [Aliikangiella coralliicola]TQV85001.1 DUF4345 domain-containing protein [Aliikangiella coralliicola]